MQTSVVNLSERGKLRLRIAARLLRQMGRRFRDADFYRCVLVEIRSLDEERQQHLRDMVDWLDVYESTRCEFIDESTRFRARQKNRTKSGNKGAAHPSASGETFGITKE